MQTDLTTTGKAQIPGPLEIAPPDRPVPAPPKPKVTTDRGEIEAFFRRMRR